jgi:hypothetical protein
MCVHFICTDVRTSTTLDPRSTLNTSRGSSWRIRSVLDRTSPRHEKLLAAWRAEKQADGSLINYWLLQAESCMEWSGHRPDERHMHERRARASHNGDAYVHALVGTVGAGGAACAPFGRGPEEAGTANRGTASTLCLSVMNKPAAPRTRLE